MDFGAPVNGPFYIVGRGLETKLIKSIYLDKLFASNHNKKRTTVAHLEQ